MIGFGPGKRADRDGPEKRIEGEREVSAAAEGRRPLNKKQALALFVLGGGAFVAFVFHRDATKAPPEPKPPIGQIGMVLSGPPPPVPAPPPSTLAVLATPPVPPSPGASLATALPPSGRPGQTEATRRRVYSYGTAQTAQQPQAAAASATPLGDASGEPQRPSVAFKASRVPGIKAGAALDRTYLLMPSVVKCVTDIAIDTTQPGAILCHTTETMRSPLGVVLMEKGTTITGTYGGVQQGQGRFPAVAATAITPNGVPVELGAPMTDALGRSGVDGDVDNHFGARFGAAVLLLASQGAIQVAQSALQAQNKGGSYTNLSLGTVEGPVTEVLRRTLDISPTISVPQGREIAFLTTKPIDFSDAYELRMAR